MRLDRLDRIVLTVKNIDKALDFYGRILGMDMVTFGQGRKALRFGCQKINLHEQGNESEPKAQHPLPGSADLCFITQEPVPEIVTYLRDHGVPIIEGPVNRTGSMGPLLSIYFRDPDLNLIEVANYLDA